MGILLPPPPSSKSTSTSSTNATPLSNSKSTEHSQSETLKSVFDSFDSLQISSNGPEVDKTKKNENDWVDFENIPKSTTSTTIKEMDNVKNQDQSADSDLWSDFSSCNTNTNKINTSNANQFDDWAKFS